MSTTCETCRPACPSPFARVVVSYLVRGGTTVAWSLQPSFLVQRPHVFSLEVGQSLNPAAGDWEQVGAPVTDVYSAVDGVQRQFAKGRWQAYRVKLIAGGQTYYSEPTALAGTLSRYDWNIAREFFRLELVRMRAFAGQEGYLLKRRVTGERCPACLDTQTQECRNPACEVCYGTGFRCGYFYPMHCVWADFDPRSYYTNQSDRGMVNDVVVKARMTNIWMLEAYDVWVNRKTDDRYHIHRVSDVAEVRGVPIAASVEMRLAAATDPIYAVTIPAQTEPVLASGRRI